MPYAPGEEWHLPSWNCTSLFFLWMMQMDIREHEGNGSQSLAWVCWTQKIHAKQETSRRRGFGMGQFSLTFHGCCLLFDDEVAAAAPSSHAGSLCVLSLSASPAVGCPWCFPLQSALSKAIYGNAGECVLPPATRLS